VTSPKEEGHLVSLRPACVVGIVRESWITHLENVPFDILHLGAAWLWGTRVEVSVAIFQNQVEILEPFSRHHDLGSAWQDGKLTSCTTRLR
jgi:hypothetical protein